MFCQSFSVGVIPTGQGGGWDVEEVGSILNVGETDEFGNLFEESFGGVCFGGESGIVGGEVAVAVLAVELEGSDGEFDCLGSQREIFDPSRFRGPVKIRSGSERSFSVDIVGDCVAARAQTTLQYGANGKPDWFFWRRPRFVNHAKAGEVQRSSPELQTLTLAHNRSPPALFA